MFYYLYIIKSIKSDHLYFGFSSDINKRLAKHNEGNVPSTKPYIPYKLVYFEAYRTKEEALQREHNLKLRANAWNQLRLRIQRSLNQ
jgi:putative endonuclease